MTTMQVGQTGLHHLFGAVDHAWRRLAEADLAARELVGRAGVWVGPEDGAVGGVQAGRRGPLVPLEADRAHGRGRVAGGDADRDP